MQGQFEIIIDPTDTDVSLQYTIKIDNSKFTESNDINLKIKKIILNGIEYAYTTNTITTLVDPDDPENSETQSNSPVIRKDQLLVKVEWENNEEFNEKDSEIGRVPNNVISLPISISVLQYIGD